MKQLIVLGYPNYLEDFRSKLIADYNAKKNNKAIICPLGPNYANFKPIFEGKYFSKDDCVIFNKGDVSLAATANLLFREGYIIDDIGMARTFIENKPLLYSYLKKFGYNVPKIYLGVKPDAKAIYKYIYSGDFSLMVSPDEANLYGSFPWDSPKMEGMVFYYYLGQLLSSGRFIKHTNAISVKTEFPANNYITIIPSTSPMVDSAKAQTSHEEIEALEDVCEFDETVINKIGEIPKILNATSCQVTVAWDGDKPFIANVQQTHKPYCLYGLGEELFVEKIKNRFYNHMTRYREVI